MTTAVFNVYRPGLTQPRPSIATGEALLMWKEGVTPEQQAAFHEEYETEVLNDSRLYTLVRFKSESEADTREKIARMKEDERIAVAEANGYVYPANPGGGQLSPGGFGPGMLL